MERHNKFKIRLLIAVISSMVFLLSCVSKKSIKVPLSDPMPHPRLARMQAMSLEEKDGAIYFGESRKYTKRNVAVVVLKGEAYDLGYARGVLLKSEIKSWVRDSLYMLKKYAMGTSIGNTLMMNRAKEIATFIPREQLEELKGLSAGSGIEYHTLLMINVLDTIAYGFACTSIAVRCPDGKIIRSRGLEERKRPFFNSWMLVITQPAQGNAFASVSLPGLIGVVTAMNFKKITYGTGAMSSATKGWKKGTPAWLMNRKIIQHADSLDEVGKLLEQSSRSVPKLVMATSPDHAIIYEYSTEEIAFKEIDKDYLILTNHTRLLNIRYVHPNSRDRYREAESFLTNHESDMNVKKLVELNRGEHISQSSNPYANSLHSAIFKPETLDFWIAIDPPPASRGRWVGFNLKKELDGKGNEPNPLIIE
jgi:hypothetical protein